MTISGIHFSLILMLLFTKTLDMILDTTLNLVIADTIYDVYSKNQTDDGKWTFYEGFVT